MSLKQKLQEDLKEFMKAQKAADVSTLRLLLSSIQNKEKEKFFQLSKGAETAKEQDSWLKDEEIIDVISSEVKKRRESAEMYEAGGKTEMANNEKAEIEILKRYLPQQLSQEEIFKIVKDAVAKTGAKDMKAMGAVMKELAPLVRGKADASLVSGAVKEILSQSS